MSWNDRPGLRRRPLPQHQVADLLAQACRSSWKHDKRRLSLSHTGQTSYGTLGERP